MSKLKIQIGKPTLVEDGIAGYARYRIDFSFNDEEELNDHYTLGWISPRYPDVEVYEILDNIKGWWTGWNREVFQEDAWAIQPFTVKLYRVGLKQGELALLDSATYESEE